MPKGKKKVEKPKEETPKLTKIERMSHSVGKIEGSRDTTGDESMLNQSKTLVKEAK